MKSFKSQPDLPAHLLEVTEHLHAGIEAFVEMDAPVVAAVQGAAAGAGLGIVCAADLAIAAESASFVMAYTALGLSPDGSSSWFLARHVGLHRALDLTLTNRVLLAGEALAWGLVSRVVPDQELADEAENIVRRLAVGPTSAFGAAARLVRDGNESSLRRQLAMEGSSISRLAGSADGVEGLNAFLERRSASFDGTGSPGTGPVSS